MFWKYFKRFRANNMKKARLNGKFNDFIVSYRIVDISDIEYENTQYCTNAWIHRTNINYSNAGADVLFCWIISYKICIHE